MDKEKLATGLGLFSLALGLYEVLAPEHLSETLGMEDSDKLLRSYGAREMTAGVGILSGWNPALWLWGRVTGDAVDLTTLGLALSPENPKRTNVVIAIVAVLGVTALDILCALQHTRE